MTGDPLKPVPALLAKLGSIAVHAVEYLSPEGHPLDLDALKSLLRDPDVTVWLDQMGEMSLVPKKR